MRSDGPDVPETPDFWRELETQLRSAARHNQPHRFGHLISAWHRLVGLLARPARVALRQGLGHAVASLAVVMAALVPIISHSSQISQVGGDSPTAFSLWALHSSSERLLGEQGTLSRVTPSDEARDRLLAAPVRHRAPTQSGDPVDRVWLAAQANGDFQIPTASSAEESPQPTDGGSTAV